MKALIFTILAGVIASSAVIGSYAVATDLNSEMDTLGGNTDLINKVRSIDPKNRVRIVQNRAVDRTMRLELGVNYGAAEGGDPYVNTNNLGASADFHFNPNWSLGARYYNSSNTLNNEGKRVYAEAAAAGPDSPKQFPSVDYASDTWLGVVNWYPTYGKLNFFDRGIAQFDLYLLAGAGKVLLSSGSSDTWTAGGGVGIWLSQYFSTRLEARYQSYQDQPRGYEKRDIDLTVLQASIGLLLF
jgi:outer membrane beta-barrel protein